jgi:hypothetical protein
MCGKAHRLCSSLSNFAPDETKLPCLILLRGYVVVGNQASLRWRKSYEFCRVSARPHCDDSPRLQAEGFWNDSAVSSHGF